MRPSATILAFGCALLSLVACSQSVRRRSVMTYTEDAARAYAEAMDDYRSGNCLDAVSAFRGVRREFPYSRFAALAELRLADCKFREQEYEEAITAYRAWIRFHRTHADVPYARYRIALSYVEQIPDDFFLTPASWRRDQESTHDALRQLRRFLRDYPRSRYAARARQHMRECLTLLARHDLYVAGFYLDREKPRAAVFRLRAMLRAYPDSTVAPEAMLLLGRTHMQMRQRAEAREVFAELTERYPRTGWARQARAYLAYLGGPPPRRGPPRPSPSEPLPAASSPPPAAQREQEPEGQPGEAPPAPESEGEGAGEGETEEEPEGAPSGQSETEGPEAEAAE